MKKYIKIPLQIMCVLFIIINILIIIQAYGFTHFRENTSQTDFKPGFSTLFTGVKIPKPKTQEYPKIKYQTLKIPAGQNRFLEAWLLQPSTTSKGLVILFHGFRAEKSSMLDRAYVLLNLGYKIMLVDFPAAGNSYGTQNTMGYYEADSVKQSYEYAWKELNEKNIILGGFSMGAVAIIKAQHDYNLNVKALILEAPYGKMIDASKVRLQKIPYIGIPFSYLITFWGGIINGYDAFSMNPEEYNKQVFTPTLLLCGGQDPRIPVDESERIFNNSGSKIKEFKVFPKSYHHSYLEKYPTEWKETVQKFLVKAQTHKE